MAKNAGKLVARVLDRLDEELVQRQTRSGIYKHDYKDKSQDFLAGYAQGLYQSRVAIRFWFEGEGIQILTAVRL